MKTVRFISQPRQKSAGQPLPPAISFLFFSLGLMSRSLLCRPLASQLQWLDGATGPSGEASQSAVSSKELQTARLSVPKSSVGHLLYFFLLHPLKYICFTVWIYRSFSFFSAALGNSDAVKGVKKRLLPASTR